MSSGGGSRGRSTGRAGALFLAFWGLYLWTALPGVAPVDGGELTLASASLGIAHPPGFPVYIITAHGFTLLPLGSLAHRTNLVSALFGALTVVLLYLLARRLVPDESSTGWGALLAATLFGLSRTPWQVAGAAEVYSLTMALCVGALLAASLDRPSGDRIAAFLLGMGLATHLVIALVTLPAAVALAGVRTRPARKRVELPLFLLLGVAAPLTSMAIRAGAHPSLCWGRPRTWLRFKSHVTAWQYRTHLFEAGLDETLEQVWLGLERWATEAIYLWPLLLLVAIPLLVNRNRRGLGMVAAWLFGLSLGYTSIYQIAEDRESYLLPAFLATSLLAALGLTWFHRRGSDRLGRWLPSTVGLLLVVGVAASHWTELDRRREHLAGDAARAVLQSARSGALVLTSDWQFYAPALYLRWAEGVRPDLVLLDVNLLRYSWYPELLEQEDPDLLARVGAELEAFRAQQRLFEGGGRYDPAEIQGRFEALIQAFEQEVRRRGGVAYVTLLTEEFVRRGRRVTGEGYLERLGSPPVRVPHGLLQAPVRTGGRRLALTDALRTKVLPSLEHALVATAAALGAEGRPGEGVAPARRALELGTGNPRTRELLGDCLLMDGRIDEALVHYRFLVESGHRHPRLLAKLKGIQAEAPAGLDKPGRFGQNPDLP